MERREIVTMAFLSAGAYYLTYLLLNPKSWLRSAIGKLRPWVLVGQVQTFYIHPIKSSRAIEFDEVEATPDGLTHGEYSDRNLVIVNTEKNRFVDCSPGPGNNPKLVLIETKIENDFLALGAKGLDRRVGVNLKDIVDKGEIAKIKFWTDEFVIAGYDCGDDVGDWLTEFLESAPGKYRLLYYHPNLFNVRLIREESETRHLVDASRDDRTIFSNSAPYLLATQATLNDLNTKLEKKVSMRNFRPNIVLKGTKPQDEHNWAEIKIGEARFLNLKPCGRCSLTTVNPETAEVSRKAEPLLTLNKYHCPPPEEKALYGGNPYFGINLLLDSPPQSIHVGDNVYARYK